jgi:peroxiredoxin
MDPEAVSTALKTAFLEIRELDLPINERLGLYTRAVERIFPAYAGAIEALVARLDVAGSGALAPAVGTAMPPFLLPNDQGLLVSLDDVLRTGPAAIVFFRGHWCPYCRMTSQTLAQISESVRAKGGRVVAITPECQRFARQQKVEADGDFDILCDAGKGYAASLNLLIWLGTDIQTLLSSLGRDLCAYQGDPSWFVPIPATFVVSQGGIITARHIDPDYRRRMDTEVLLRAIEAAS